MIIILIAYNYIRLNPYSAFLIKYKTDNISTYYIYIYLQEIKIIIMVKKLYCTHKYRSETFKYQTFYFVFILLNMYNDDNNKQINFN